MLGVDWRFLVAYILGGLTFIPACLILILWHAYLIFPVKDSPNADDLEASPPLTSVLELGGACFAPQFVGRTTRQRVGALQRPARSDFCAFMLIRIVGFVVT